MPHCAAARARRARHISRVARGNRARDSRKDLPRDAARRAAMTAQNLDSLRDWVGKTETRSDTVTAWPVAALAATLDRNDPEPKPGDALPPGWHWLYFLEAKPASELRPDGHPRRGRFPPRGTPARPG